MCLQLHDVSERVDRKVHDAVLQAHGSNNETLDLLVILRGIINVSRLRFVFRGKDTHIHKKGQENNSDVEGD